MRAAALLALPLLLAGCLAGEPAASPLTGQIDGAVVDHLLRPFGNHTVTLVQLDRTDQTSPLGGFTFRAVPPGFYTLTTKLEDGPVATQIVDVQAGRITRTILQLVPPAPSLPYFEAHTFRSPGESPEAGEVCEACEWAVPLDAARPREVTFEALWDSGPALGEPRDLLDIQITDGLGFPLYDGNGLASPLSISIDGADIRPEAPELRVQVRYGQGFLPSAQPFSMHAILTTYHGGTKAETLGIVS